MTYNKGVHKMLQTMNRLWLIPLVVATGLCVLAPAQPVWAEQEAAECTTSTGQPGIKVSFLFFGQGPDANCIEAGDGSFLTNPIVRVIMVVLSFLAGGVFLAVVGGIVWGGFLYMTARGNAGQTEKAIMVIVQSVIGLLLFIFMFAILNFLIPGGIFT